MSRTLADGNMKITLLTSAPADLAAITLTELNAGTDISCGVKHPFSHGAAGSNTINEKAVCQKGNPQVFTDSTYTVSMTAFREFGEDGLPDSAKDVAFEAFREKGTVAWLVVRDQVGKASGVDWAAGDPYSAYEVMCDDPQNPTDEGGYIKRVIPIAVQNAELDKTVVEAGA